MTSLFYSPSILHVGNLKFLHPAESHHAFGAGFLLIGAMMTAEVLSGKVWHRSQIRTLMFPATLIMLGWGMMLVTTVEPRARLVHLSMGIPMVAGGWERPTMGPRAFAHIEQSLSIFEDMRLPIQQVGEILGAADDYVIGFVTRQLATERAVARHGLSVEEYQDALEPYVARMIERGDFPNLKRFAAEEWRIEGDGRFERGLTYLLDGVSAALAAPR